MLPSLTCPRCVDGRTAEGVTCGHCLGQAIIVATCELCRIDVADHWDEDGNPRCSTCANTAHRNGEEAA